MTSTLLHLLRHGAPETPGLLMGRTDGAPTAKGLSACVAQADGLGLASILSSDLRRASDAGEQIAQDYGQSLYIDPRWRELDFGDWDGLSTRDIDSVALGRFWEDPERCPPPRGERWSQLTARVGDALRVLPRSPVLVVTHGGAMRAALAVLCGFEHRHLWAIDLPYGAMLSLRLWPGATAGATPGGQIIGLFP